MKSCSAVKMCAAQGDMQIRIMPPHTSLTDFRLDCTSAFGICHLYHTHQHIDSLLILADMGGSGKLAADGFRRIRCYRVNSLGQW